MSTAGPSSNTMDGFAIITSLGRRIGGRKIGIEYSGTLHQFQAHFLIVANNYQFILLLNK